MDSQHIFITDDDYNLVNGLVDANRNVIMKLVGVIDDDAKIKNVVGMGKIFYFWSKQPVFRWVRYSTHIIVDLRPNPKGGYTLKRTPIGLKCLFTASNVRTLFLDKAITRGIFSWTVQIDFGKKTERRIDFWLGTTSSDRLDILEEHTFGYDEGSCCFEFMWLRRDGSFGITIHGGVFAHNWFFGANENALFSLEANADVQTLCLFVEKMKLPFGISNVKAPYHLGMSGDEFNNGQSFTSVNFRRLARPTPSDVKCEFVQRKSRAA